MPNKTNDNSGSRDSDHDATEGGTDAQDTDVRDAGSGADRDDADTSDERDNGRDDDTDDSDGDGEGDAGRGRRGRRGDDKTARTIAALRGDFKDERAKRQTAEKATAALQKQFDQAQAAQGAQMDALAKALGLKKADTPPSPEEVAKDFNKKLEAANSETDTERQRADTAQERYREAATHLAVYLTADTHGANPQALLDSARFLRTVAGLDPDDKGFADDIAQAIKDAVEGNDRLRKPKPRATADRSGGEMNTGTARQRKRPASLNEAVTKHYDRAR